MAAVLEHPSSPSPSFSSGQGGKGTHSHPFSGARQLLLPALAEPRSAAGCCVSRHSEFRSGLIVQCVKNIKMGSLKKQQPPPTPEINSKGLQNAEAAVLSTLQRYRR